MTDGTNLEPAEQASFENAQRLYTDALILYKRDRFASAATLAVFGIEEMGKAKTCRALATQQVTREQLKDIQKAIKDHQAKIDFATFAVDVAMYAKAMLEIVEQISQIGDKEKQAQILNYILSLKPTEVIEFHTLRLRATYVDINIETGELLSSPQTITAQQANQAIEKLRDVITEYENESLD